jgi:hypothetical protein
MSHTEKYPTCRNQWFEAHEEGLEKVKGEWKYVKVEEEQAAGEEREEGMGEPVKTGQEQLETSRARRQRKVDEFLVAVKHWCANWKARMSRALRYRVRFSIPMLVFFVSRLFSYSCCAVR